jgi:nucleoid DNA-binding protein
LYLQGKTHVIAKELADGNDVPRGNLGKLSLYTRKERHGVNPSNGTKIIIPSKVCTKFKQAKHLTEMIDNKFNNK